MAVGIMHEPLTYTRDRKDVSYFRDLIDSHSGDSTAKERLARHGRELRVELGRRDSRTAKAFRQL